MTIFEQLKEDLKTSMKSRNGTKTQTLRILISDIKKDAVDSGADRENIPDETVLKIMDKAAKTRREAIKIYSDSNRTDLAQSENDELKIIQKYMPKQLSDEELREIVQKIKDENTNLQGMALMGKIMPLVKGKADPERIKPLL